MPAELRLDLKTEQGMHRINVQAFIDAVQASAELLHQLDREVAAGQFEWYFTQLGIGSGIAVFAGEWSITDEELPVESEIERASRRIVDRYLSGLELLDRAAKWPADYTMEALQAAQRLAQVLRNGVVELVVSIPGEQRSVKLTERVTANVKDLVSEGYVTLGSVEGVVETVSLARNQRVFRVRDAVTGSSVVCHFSGAQFEVVRNALGRRVLVAGELKHSPSGQLLAVRTIDFVRVFEERQLPTVDEILGIAPDFTDGLPSEDFINRMHDEDG